MIKEHRPRLEPKQAKNNVFLSKEVPMAYKISDACISCGACESVCPTGAISAGETQYVIDPETCIDCGACESTCPVGAISPA